MLPVNLSLNLYTPCPEPFIIRFGIHGQGLNFAVEIVAWADDFGGHCPPLNGSRVYGLGLVEPSIV